jgi:hypothetical protein
MGGQEMSLDDVLLILLGWVIGMHTTFILLLLAGYFQL